MSRNFEYLINKYGRPVLKFTEAIQEMDYTLAGAYACRNRGTFPIKTLDTRGGAIKVAVADLADWLDGQSADELPPRDVPRRPGRPTKAEQLRRQQAAQASSSTQQK